MITNSNRTFGDVVDAHQAEVVRYLRWLTGDPTEAEDLFQETFLRAGDVAELELFIGAALERLGC